MTARPVPVTEGGGTPITPAGRFETNPGDSDTVPDDTPLGEQHGGTYAW